MNVRPKSPTTVTLLHSGCATFYAECCWYFVSKSTCTTGWQILSGFVDLLKLAAPDLGDTASNRVISLIIKGFIHFLEYAVRHDWAAVIIGLACQFLT